jgi:hypothetical protein
VSRSDELPSDDPPPMHPLENPVIWLLVQVAEYTLVILLLRWILPDTTSFWIGFAILILIFIGLTLANYAIRRRFIPR